MTLSTAIVDADGTVVHSDGDALPIYSVAKTFTACAVIHAGIDLHAPVEQWVDAAWLPGDTGITVKHLLQHTSGLRDYTGLAEYARAIEDGAPPWSDADYAARTLQQPLLFAPGSSFAYSNPGYRLLQRVLELEFGTPWPAILHERIIAPLGLAETRSVQGVFADDLPDYPAEWVWPGLILSTAADTARFMTSAMVEPLLREPLAVPGAHPPWVDPHYGFGLMIEPGVMYGHNGSGPGYSASCFHFFGSGLTGCVLSGEHDEAGTLAQLEALVDAYTG